MLINIQNFMLTFVKISDEYTINVIEFNIIITLFELYRSSGCLNFGFINGNRRVSKYEG